MLLSLNNLFFSIFPLKSYFLKLFYSLLYFFSFYYSSKDLRQTIMLSFSWVVENSEFWLIFDLMEEHSLKLLRSSQNYSSNWGYSYKKSIKSSIISKSSSLYIICLWLSSFSNYFKFFNEIFIFYFFNK